MTATAGAAKAPGGPLGPRMPAVRHAAEVLRRLASSASPLTAGALATSVGMPRSSTYQLLQVLCDEGLVVHVPEARAYTLGVGVFELGNAYLRHEPLEHLARPLLTRLVREVGETAQLGILHGNETLYLLKEQPEHATALVTDVGVRLPAHLTASGRAILALLSPANVAAHFAPPGSFVTRTEQGPRSLRELTTLLQQDRRRGWSVENGSVTDGITCLSAAVTDHLDQPVAAVTLSFLYYAHPEPTWEYLARRIVATADALTRRLGGTPDRHAVRA